MRITTTTRIRLRDRTWRWAMVRLVLLALAGVVALVGVTLAVEVAVVVAGGAPPWWGFLQAALALRVYLCSRGGNAQVDDPSGPADG